MNIYKLLTLYVNSKDSIYNSGINFEDFSDLHNAIFKSQQIFDNKTIGIIDEFPYIFFFLNEYAYENNKKYYPFLSKIDPKYNTPFIQIQNNVAEKFTSISDVDYLVCMNCNNLKDFILRKTYFSNSYGIISMYEKNHSI